MKKILTFITIIILFTFSNISNVDASNIEVNRSGSYTVELVANQIYLPWQQTEFTDRQYITSANLDLVITDTGDNVQIDDGDTDMINRSVTIDDSEVISNEVGDYPIVYCLDYDYLGHTYHLPTTSTVHVVDYNTLTPEVDQGIDITNPEVSPPNINNGIEPMPIPTVDIVAPEVDTVAPEVDAVVPEIDAVVPEEQKILNTGLYSTTLLLLTSSLLALIVFRFIYSKKKEKDL